MSQALTDLYNSAGGPGWLRAENWTYGEPCNDGWHGVICCPIDFPYLIGPEFDPANQRCSRTAERRRLSHDGATYIDVTDIPGMTDHLCSAGTAYGDDRDLARCTVVQVDLNANNLTGTIDFHVDTYPSPDLRTRGFTNLQLLGLAENHLVGNLPQWMIEVPNLVKITLGGNSFTRSDANYLIARSFCNSPGSNCSKSGLPGFGGAEVSGSCNAFGDNIVILEPYNGGCHVCDPTSTVLSNWYLLMFGYFFFLAIYVGAVWVAAKGPFHRLVRCCATKYGQSLKRWVAASVVISVHYQTIILVSSVRPYWPREAQIAFNFLALDYVAFTETSCMTNNVEGIFNQGLANNLIAQAEANSLLLFLLMMPPMMIAFNSLLKLLMKFFRNRELRKGITEHDDGALAKINKYVNFTFNVLADYIPNIEFVCSVLMATLLGSSLKVAKQLITWSGSFGMVFGSVLIAVQPSVWMLYGRDAAVAQRDRKESVLQAAGIPKDTFRVTFLTEPFKERAASYQLVILVQQFALFFCAWYSYNGAPRMSMPVDDVIWGHTGAFLTLMISWAWHSLTDPWDSAFLNAASSRLYFAEICILLSGIGWRNYYEDTFMGGTFAAIIVICAIGALPLTIVYLMVGLKATECSTRLMDGVSVKYLPLWIRGMRWEQMDLPKGTMAICYIHANTPTASSVHEALSSSGGKTQLEEDPRRLDDFTVAFDKFLAELAIGFSSSNLSAQVRKYGAESVKAAQFESLKFAKRRMKKQLKAFGVDTRKPKVEGDEDDGTSDEEDYTPADWEPPPEPALVKRAASGTLSRGSSQALSRQPSGAALRSEASRAALTRLPSGDDFGDDDDGAGATVPVLGASKSEVNRAALASLPSIDDFGDDEPGLSVDSSELSRIPSATAADAPAADSPEADAPAADDASAPAGAPAPEDASSTEGAPAPEAALDSHPESPPPSPPSPPASPPEDAPQLPRAASRSGLTDGTCLTRGQSSVGPGGSQLLRSASKSMADGTVLSGGQSSASLIRGTSLSRGQSSVSAMTDGTVLAGGKSSASLVAGTSLTRGRSSVSAMTDGTVLAGGKSSASLVRGTSLSQGHSSVSAMTDGTVLAGCKSSASLARGTSLSRGQSSVSSMTDGTVLAGGHASKSMADGTILTRGESRSTALSKGTVLEGYDGLPSIAAGTSLERGQSNVASMAAGTALARGKSSVPSMAAGTSLAPKGGKKLEYYGAAALMQRVERGEFSKDYESHLIHLDKGKTRRHGKMDQALEDKVVKQKFKGREPVLERTPVEPPVVPITGGHLSAGRYAFLASNIEWLVSASQDVSEAKKDVSAWPREANRGEPGDKQLDQQMAGVLEILNRTNFGMGEDVPGQVQSKNMASIGYSVRLCLHQHREAGTFNGRAAQIRQRFYLQVVDWRLISEANERFVVLPNEYLGQWAGRRLRVNEPNFSGGPMARGSDAVARLCHEGRAIMYDSAFTNVLALPAGVRARVLHHSIEYDKASMTTFTDRPWGDLGALMRALSTKGDEVGKSSKIFDAPIGNLVLKPGCSAGVLAQDIMTLVQDMSRDGATAEDADLEGLMKEVKRQMFEVGRDIVDAEAPFKELVSSFPKIIKADGHGVSLHLCASDTRRMGPDPTREINIWITVVDLDAHNPINVAKGGTLTPKASGHGGMPREPYLVQGEVLYVRSIDELDAEDKKEEEELEMEHKRLLTSRIARARSRKGGGDNGDSLNRQTSEASVSSAGAGAPADDDEEDEAADRV